jgi:hypothetical protein
MERMIAPEREQEKQVWLQRMMLEQKAWLQQMTLKQTQLERIT